MQFKFDIGDRVDCGPPDWYNNTPGTVTDRWVEASLYPITVNAYRVEWDDGFVEEEDYPDANVWVENELKFYYET